jgi:hypothetical protein
MREHVKYFRAGFFALVVRDACNAYPELRRWVRCGGHRSTDGIILTADGIG